MKSGVTLHLNTVNNLMFLSVVDSFIQQPGDLRTEFLCVLTRSPLVGTFRIEYSKFQLISPITFDRFSFFNWKVCKLVSVCKLFSQSGKMKTIPCVRVYVYIHVHKCVWILLYCVLLV